MDDAGRDGDDDMMFSEYSVDDSLDPLSRLERYYSSEFSLQRLALVRELASTASFASFPATVRTILPLIGVFGVDSEPVVRQAFVQQLVPLAAFLSEHGDDGYANIINTLIPFANELLDDRNIDVGNAAMTTICKLATYVRPRDIEDHLLRIALNHAHNETIEDVRVVAAQLFNEWASLFGPDLCATTVLREVTLLAHDSSFLVRKAVATNLAEIAKVISPAAAAERLVPLFQELSADDIWGVRKACAEGLVAISNTVTPAARVKFLAPIFKALSEDSSRWVRVAAFQNLGPFIHSMRAEDITPALLRSYCDMAFQAEDAGDSDFAEYCAYSFPAVVKAVGRDRWRELEDAFSTMLKDTLWKVRKSLAYSLHEVAKEVGLEISERHLSSAFELLLHDIDEVKIGVIDGCDAFLSVLSPAQREKHVATLCAVPLESDNWRLRNHVAARLGPVAKLIPTKSSTSISDLTIKFLMDSVTEVRITTFRSCALLLDHLKGTAEYASYLSQIASLAKRDVFQSRQIFCYIFQQVVELDSSNVAQNDLLSLFVKLAEDMVSNVRLVVARVVATSLNNREAWRNNPKVQYITMKLSNDVEPDISVMALAQLPPLCHPALAAHYFNHIGRLERAQ